jgi:hypothetical protein
MAPAMDLPEINFDQMKKLDILQTYWLLFEHMKNDFVHRGDFIKALTTNICSSGVVTFPLATDSSMAQSVSTVFKGLTEAGGIVREQLLVGLEQLTS